MRYAVVSAAVFSGAMFLAPGSHAPLGGAQHVTSFLTKSSAHTTQVAPRPALPRVTLADAAVNRTAEAQPATKPSQPVITSVGVVAGDTLSHIAEQNNSSVARLYAANPAILNPDVIVPGQQLRIPAADEQLVDRPLPISPSVVATTQVNVVTPSQPTSPTMPAVSAASIASGSVWDLLAQCESGGNWSINTGNGFYGGLQFTLATWHSLGGSGLPNQASREEQIARATTLQARSGWGQWPACTAKLGLR